MKHDFETGIKGGERRFSKNDSQWLDPERSCLVPTGDGLLFAEGLRKSMKQLEIERTPLAEERFKPRWVTGGGVKRLYWLVWVVKEYCTHAEVQWRILKRFQDAGWPRWIPDILVAGPGINTGECLHNAVVALNRAQTACKIKFFRDGTTNGIRWEKV